MVIPSLRLRCGYMCVYIRTDTSYMIRAWTVMLASACPLSISKIPRDPCERERKNPKVVTNNPWSVSVGSEVGWLLRRSQGPAILEFMPNAAASRRT